MIKKEGIEHIASQTLTNGEPEVNCYCAYKAEKFANEGIPCGEWLNSLGKLILIAPL